MSGLLPHPTLQGSRFRRERKRPDNQNEDPINLWVPLGLALGSPIFPSGCEGKLGVALESLQGLRDLT